MHLLKFKKYYFLNKFKKNNIDNLDNNTSIIYRNYEKENYLSNLMKLKNYCRMKRIKLYLSNNFKLAIKLGLDGAYIPSYNSELNHLSYKYKKDFILIGSAHNLKEIRNKELQKINKIVLSSVFKKNKNYLGFNKFNLKSKLTSKEVIALGGISKRNFKRLKLIKCFSFAGISYFE
tara:strand:- start:12 stop:539 length:528 start_codon:yes stop_codon:yes gene_type:complete